MNEEQSLAGVPVAVSPTTPSSVNSYGSSGMMPFPSDMSSSSAENSRDSPLVVPNVQTLVQNCQLGDQVPRDVNPQVSSGDNLQAVNAVTQPGAPKEEEDEAYDSEEDDEEDDEREVVEIDGQQLFFKSSLVRIADQVVKVCFFILEEDDPSISDPDHPFRQIWEKCAVCIIVSDLSVTPASAAGDLRRSIERWQAVCSKKGRDNKMQSALVIGNKTDRIVHPNVLDVMLEASTSEGLIFIPLCARDEQDGELIDVAFKVACDVSSETVLQQSQRQTIVVPPSKELSEPETTSESPASSTTGSYSSYSKYPVATSKNKDCAIM